MERIRNTAHELGKETKNRSERQVRLHTNSLLSAIDKTSLGIEFVSLSEQVDTSTPAGKLVFTVLGAVAELERSLIGERVRAGLRNARAKGRRLGRPPKVLDFARVKALRAQGASWRAIGRELGVSTATAFYGGAKMSGKVKLSTANGRKSHA